MKVGVGLVGDGGAGEAGVSPSAYFGQKTILRSLELEAFTVAEGRKRKKHQEADQHKHCERCCQEQKPLKLSTSCI